MHKRFKNTRDQKCCKLYRTRKVTRFISVLLLCALLLGSTDTLAMGRRPSSQPPEAEIEEATLAITGMSCGGCARQAEKALLKTPGVYSAKVDFSSSQGYVKFDKGQVEIEELVKIVNNCGFVCAIKTE